MSTALAYAKVNLALVVGPLREDGKHEVVTVMHRVSLADAIELVAAPSLEIEGFAGDTLVRAALEALAQAIGVKPGWRVRIEKEIPVAAGLGGGSSDAASALRLANETLVAPLDDPELTRLAAGLGADVPFFLAAGPQAATGDGATLAPLDLPQEWSVLLVLPQGEAKSSTRAVYEEFDRRDGPAGFDERRAALVEAIAARDVRAFPPNDLASSPLSDELRSLGAFRADVTGSGPAVYALFESHEVAEAAEQAIRPRGRTWITRPAW